MLLKVGEVSGVCLSPTAKNAKNSISLLSLFFSFNPLYICVTDMRQMPYIGPTYYLRRKCYDAFFEAHCFDSKECVFNKELEYP